jgi:hypothetical protein
VKVGDLVKYKNLHGHVVSGEFVSRGWTGVVIECIEVCTHRDLLVLWSHGTATESSSSLQVVTA